MVDVRPVSSSREFKQFIDYAYVRNRCDAHWIPPLRLSEQERLDPRKNPFFAHADHRLFLARRDGRIAGRIAVFDDRLHNEVHHDGVASFGFFEAEDEQATRPLFAAAEAWGREHGRARMRGPLNPSLNESAGLLVEGFDSDPVLMMPHNPVEYARFIEAAGYRKVKDLYAWIYDMDRGVQPVVEKLANRIKDKHGISVRQFSLKEFAREVELLRQVYCGAWEHNWGFVPPTADEFKRLAAELKPIFDPQAAVLAEVAGKPVACAVAIPDVNQAFKGTDGRLFPKGLVRLLGRKWIVTQARLLLLGVLPEYRAYGLYPLLIHELHKQASKTRYRRLEFSWVLEDNRDINQPAEQAGATHYKTYRLYEKDLNPIP
jgi:GNAT superfamily N-acetyltransferase